MLIQNQGQEGTNVLLCNKYCFYHKCSIFQFDYPSSYSIDIGFRRRIQINIHPYPKPKFLEDLVPKYVLYLLAKRMFLAARSRCTKRRRSKYRMPAATWHAHSLSSYPGVALSGCRIRYSRRDPNGTSSCTIAKGGPWNGIQIMINNKYYSLCFQIILITSD